MDANNARELFQYLENVAMQRLYRKGERAPIALCPEPDGLSAVTFVRRRQQIPRLDIVISWEEVARVFNGEKID